MSDKIKCPICGSGNFEENDFDICDECFWENDGVQYHNPNFSGGANNLSQNGYKKWWNKLNSVLPHLIEKYGVKKMQVPALWRFSGLLVPREHLKEFIEEVTKSNIMLRLDFYNICKKYNYNSMTFHGYPFIKSNSTKENNDEIINILFSENPIKTCKKYNLIQMVELLMKSDDAKKFWEATVPCLEAEPNPESI